MRRSLLATTAIAALVLAPSLALAQAQSNGPGATQEQPRNQEHGTPQGAKPAPGQAAPGKSVETQTPAAPNRMNGQAEPQAPGGKQAQPQHLQGQAEPQAPGGKQAQPQPQGPRGQQPLQGQAQPQPQGPRGQQQLQGQAQQPKGTQRVEGQEQEQQGPAGKAAGTQQRTTGTAGVAGGRGQVQVTQQQRTQIHERLAHFRPERIEHPQFSISVGVEIPRSVHIEVLPPEIVEIVPEYQGFDYVMVGDEILIIDPDSLLIVAVIPA